MGGNALALVNVKSKRISKEEFNYYTAKVVGVIYEIIAELNLNGDFVKNEPHVVLAYKNKETFGDLDLLIDKELLSHIKYEDILKKIALSFNYEGNLPYLEKEPNAMTFSFGVPSSEDSVFFQVDLIESENGYYDFHSKYLNWNDLGNLIGVVASSNGFLKYGHYGLKFQFRDGDNLYAEHVLTTNWNKALSFFGYNSDVYDKGFENIEDIYEYASSSDFFNKELYAFENRNHVQRTRDKKRPTYNGFLNFIENKDFSNKIKMNPELWKARVYDYFPSFANIEKEIIKKNENKKEFKKYFNAKYLIEYKPELFQKEIGDYMGKLKNIVDNIEEFVLLNKENSIKMLIELNEKSLKKSKFKP